MKFQDDFLEQVRTTVNIVDVVGSYLRLRKSGQNFAALCPFHNEKTPSFMVNEARQLFKCFGCGVGGDLFKFVMKIENVAFPEAIRFVAERHGIPLPQQHPRDARRTEKRERMLALMKAAEEFFRERLIESEPVLRYLKKRQISRETIESFGLGHAPPGARLIRELDSKGFAGAEVEACGLAARSASAELYDKFRNRVIFPIQDLMGRTIAFGGRILGEGMPKYLNSPETALYHKGSHLFALAQTRDEIRRRNVAILVEGYFDCLVPFQFGIRNVVASLGTSLTENQVKLLSRYTQNVIVNFDPDSAGVSAAIRSIDLFLEQGFHVNVVNLPSGDDPDSFILRMGPEAYHDKLKNSAPYLDFLLNHWISRQRDPSSPTGKQQVVSEILPYLVKMPNRIERSEYASRIAARLRIDESVLLVEMRKYSRPSKLQPRLSSLSSLDEPTPAESYLLRAALDDEHGSKVLQEVEADLLEGLRTEEIFAKIRDLEKRNQEISVLKVRDLLEENDSNLLDRLVLQSPGVPITQDIINSSVAALRDLQIARLSRQVQEAITTEEESGVAPERLNDLLRRKERLQRQKQGVVP